jgi:hypothetical protein
VYENSKERGQIGKTGRLVREAGARFELEVVFDEVERTPKDTSKNGKYFEHKFAFRTYLNLVTR